MNARITYLILTSILSIISYTMHAQYTIQGTLTNSQQQPIEGAVIVTYDLEHHLISYTTSDATGSYSLKESTVLPSRIEITHMAYRKQEKRIDPQELNTNTVFDFILLEHAKELDDVIIFSYAHKEKDTVLLDLQKLRLHEDTNLKEILKKIPNFKLGSNGSIIYKGKSIDKILVNKKESFTQQNSIALESIENRIIEDISVINNYQNDFAIDFDATEESVLNIDTKSEAKQIKTGSVLGRYGYQDAYEIKAKGLWFGNQVNAFITHNTNTTGKNTIKANELQQLFGSQKSISDYQAQSLNGLFSSDENLKKNFFSSTNLTLRNQGERLKSAAVLYYITPNRIALTTTTLATVNDIPLLENSSDLRSKSDAFLGAIALDYKVAPHTIVSYGLHVNVANDTETNTITNELFTVQEDTISNLFNTIVSDHVQHIKTVYSHISVASKLAPKLILNTSTGYQLEQGTLFNSYHIFENNRTQTNPIQDYQYTHHVFDASSVIHYKHTDQFLPSVTVNYQHTTEGINEQPEALRLIKRDQKAYQIRIGAIGNRIFKQFKYQASIGVEYAENRTDTIPNVYTTFIPYNMAVVYENKMNRFSIHTQRNRKVNALGTGITRIVPFNQILLGDPILPKTYTEIQQWKGSYGYTNIFDAKSLSLSLSYTRYTDQLQNYLVQLENGISRSAFFLAAKAQRYGADAYYSTTALQVQHPTKIDLGISYTKTVIPTRIGGAATEVNTHSISPAIGVTTNTADLINFKLTSQASFTTNKTPTSTFDAIYTYTSFATVLKNKHWESKASFIYEHNRINDELYSRKNINLELAYTKGRMTLSMEARHLGEALGVIDNTAYNSQFTIANGISTLTLPNQSLNYIILGIQYQL